MINARIMKPVAFCIALLMIGTIIATTLAQCAYEGYGTPLMECYDASPRKKPTEMALLDGFLLINSEKEYTPTRHAEALFHYSIPSIVNQDESAELMQSAAIRAPCKVTAAMLSYWSNPDPSISRSDLITATNALLNFIEAESPNLSDCAQENIASLRALQK